MAQQQKETLKLSQKRIFHFRVCPPAKWQFFSVLARFLSPSSSSFLAPNNRGLNSPPSRWLLWRETKIPVAIPHRVRKSDGDYGARSPRNFFPTAGEMIVKIAKEKRDYLFH